MGESVIAASAVILLWFISSICRKHDLKIGIFGWTMTLIAVLGLVTISAITLGFWREGTIDGNLQPAYVNAGIMLIPLIVWVVFVVRIVFVRAARNKAAKPKSTDTAVSAA